MSDNRPKVLVAEDEFLIAMEIADIVEGAGFAVLGPVASLEAAQKLLSSGEVPDAAVIDANLASQSSAPLARELSERRVPYCVCTGYRSGDVASAFGNVPTLQKPIDAEALVHVLRKLCGQTVTS